MSSFQLTDETFTGGEAGGYHSYDLMQLLCCHLQTYCYLCVRERKNSNADELDYAKISYEHHTGAERAALFYQREINLLRQFQVQ